MNERQIRPLTQDDFSELMRLEEEVFGAAGESVLGAYYVRLCCEFFQETCFIAVEQGRAVGYVLCFVKGREAYCTTLAVASEVRSRGSKRACSVWGCSIAAGSREQRERARAGPRSAGRSGAHASSPDP